VIVVRYAGHPAGFNEDNAVGAADRAVLLAIGDRVIELVAAEATVQRRESGRLLAA
jgi:hypothetical protein